MRTLTNFSFIELVLAFRKPPVILKLAKYLENSSKEKRNALGA